tara:strand:- start:12046 stop:13734 length:1689 start_codon:yes stop_codon:yes gene_type:complete
MAVIRRGGFPRRQQDPLIQQLLEQARREAAQSSSIGSPSMYKAAAGGGIGPVAGVLTAQVLGGIRAGTAQKEAQQRQDVSNQAASMLRRAENTGQLGDNVIVNQMGDLLRMGTPTQIDRVNVTDTSSYQNVTPQDLTATQIPLEPTTIRLGPEDDPNFLERAFLGRTLKGQDISNIDQLKVAAGYDPLEYDLSMKELSKSSPPEFKKTVLLFDKEKLNEQPIQAQKYTIDGKIGYYDNNFNIINSTNKTEIQETSKKIAAKDFIVTFPDNTTKILPGIIQRNPNGGIQTIFNIPGKGSISQQDAIDKGFIKDVFLSTRKGDNLTINTGNEKPSESQKKRGELLGDKLYGKEGHLTQGENAIGALRTVRTGFEILNNAKLQGIEATGGLENLKKTIREILSGLGATVDLEKVTTQQQLTSIYNNEVLGLVGKLRGPISEKEVTFLQGIPANIGNTLEANNLISLMQMQIYQKLNDFNDFYYKYRQDKKDTANPFRATEDDIEDFYVDWRKTEQYKKTPRQYIEDLADKERELLRTNNVSAAEAAKILNQKYLLLDLDKYFRLY